MLFRRSHKLVKLSDEELAGKFKKNNSREPLGILFNRYSHLVYGLCLSYFKEPEKSKDAVLGIFEKLILKLQEAKIKNFKSWLYTVSKNYCLNALERERSALLHLINYAHYANGNGKDEHSCTEDGRTDVLFEYVSALKPGQRRCIELFYLEGKKYEEISNLTGFTPMQVKSHLQNGKRNLKLMYERNECGNNEHGDL